MTLPVNIDSTYADTGGADVALHQQHHDLLHGRYNDDQISYKTGYYYRPGHGLTSGASNQFLNELNYVPVWIHKTTTFDKIGLEVVASGASSTVRLGIYSPGADGRPSARLLDAGTISSATTGFKEITISQSLTRGLHYLAAIAGTASCTTRHVQRLFAPLSLASTSNTSTAEWLGYYEGGSGGALPATAAPHASILIATAPMILLRAA